MEENSNKTSVSANSKQHYSGDQRFDLAIRFLRFAFIVLGVITIMALLIIGIPVLFDPSKDSQAYQSIKDLFGIVLPLLGTWVGTILAFYFSERNFDAATRSSLQLHQQFTSVEEKLKSISITDKMIDIDNVPVKLIIENGKSEKDYLLNDLINILETKDNTPRERLPILDDKGHIKYIVHRSLIDKFRGEKIKDPNVNNLTLKDMVDDPKYKAVLVAFETVSSTENLADAKHRIDKNPNCSDVFVTKDGKPDSRAEGWVTNVEVAKNAQL